MEFLCSNCGKKTSGISIVIDKKHFVHMECAKEFKEKLVELNEEVEISED